MSQGCTTDHDKIYQQLAGEILRFEHKPGDALSEHYLCQRFSLSRTPVRSILQRLQENGLVQILPRKGSMVTRLNYDIVNQLIYERVAVESMVLRDFITSCTPADVERVRFAFTQLQEIGRVFFPIRNILRSAVFWRATTKCMKYGSARPTSFTFGNA